MRLCDLEKALGKVIDFLGADACMVCIDKITSAADGVRECKWRKRMKERWNKR